MNLPFAIEARIEDLATKYKTTELKKCSTNLTNNYLNNKGGNTLISSEIDVLTYSIVRMPATYSSVFNVLKNVFDIYRPKINSVIDVGSGVGTASLASYYFLGETPSYFAYEKEIEMINLGKKLTNNVININWKQIDYSENDINETAELVIASYTLNELQKEKRIPVLEKLYNLTNDLLIIIEPGTPNNFEQIKEYRNRLLELGAHIIAPCPNIDKCPITGSDWCHFSSRVSRSKIHKLLKDGEAPYEDEKYTYIAVSKNSFYKDNFHRIMRHPVIHGNSITLTTCSIDGIKQIDITKSNKQLFKDSKKTSCGEVIKL